MTQKSIRLVTEFRAKQILECYGASEQAWPEAECEAMLRLIQRHEHLQFALQQAQEFDQLIGSVESSFRSEFSEAALSQKIMTNIGAQEPVAINIARHGFAKASTRRVKSPVRIWAIAAVLTCMALIIGQVNLNQKPAVLVVAESSIDDDLFLLQTLTETTDYSVVNTDLETLILIEPSLAFDEVLI